MGGYVIEAALLLLFAFVTGCGIGYAARRISHEQAPASTAPTDVAVATEAPLAGAGPVYLDAPRDAGKDDLQRISGIGPKIERSLNEAGIYHFDQIAALGMDEQDLLNERLRFRGRIQRDDWVGQALRLMEADASA